MQFLPTKTELDRQIQDVAGEVASRMQRWKFFATQLSGVTDGQLTSLGYDSTTIAYLRSFQDALINIELKYRIQAPANNDDPSYFVGQMTRLLIF